MSAYKCPKCDKQLTRVYPRRQIYECNEHGKFKAKLRRKRKSNFDINDTSTWRATCVECGNRNMEYYNYKYHCSKCGHILYV